LINYYLTPQRGWELLLGAIAVLRQDSLRLNRATREIASVVAIAIIAASIALYDAYTRYPGTATLAPVLAAACLLVVNRGPQPTAVARLLSWRPLVFTGLISYSLYLWHAPVLDFLQSYEVTPRTGTALLWSIGVLYVVAVLSWRWIELPVRSRRVLRGNVAFTAAAAALSLALLIGGAALWKSQGLPSRFDAYVQTLVGPHPFLANAARRCAGIRPADIAMGRMCHFGTDDPAARKVIVWGDSHALALMPGYEALAQRDHLSLYLATAPACRPLLDVASARLSHSYQDRCRQYNRAMQQALEVLRPDTVVLNAYWLNPSPKMWLDRAGPERRPIEFEEALRSTLRSLHGSNRRLCAVLDVPHYPYRIPDALAMFHRRGKDPALLTMTRAEADDQQRNIDAAFSSAATSTGLRTVDLKDALCARGVCALARPDGIPLYSDDNHLSLAGVEVVTETLGQCFAQAR
jgi:hypothetical protein